jgi:hypothetical protein
LAIYVLLKAFANGGASLTGLEAISNGVSAFKPPEGPNARRTLTIMSVVLGSLVLASPSWPRAPTRLHSRAAPRR